MNGARVAHELLAAYGSWASPRARPATCGSAEGMYRAQQPGGSGGAGLGPDVATILRVQHVLRELPEGSRRVLQAEFVAGGRRARSVKDALGLSWRQWRAAVDEGVSAFGAAWAAHCAQAPRRARPSAPAARGAPSVRVLAEGVTA